MWKGLTSYPARHDMRSVFSHMLRMSEILISYYILETMPWLNFVKTLTKPTFPSLSKANIKPT